MSDHRPPPLRPVRRAPNIVAFLLTGAVIGIAIGSLIGVRASTGNYSHGTAVGLLAVTGAVIGAILGGLLAILMEHRSLR